MSRTGAQPCTVKLALLRSADRDGTGLDALADVVLRGPTGVDDDVEVVLADGLWRQQDRRHVDAARRLEGLRVGDLGGVLVLAQLDGSFAGGLAEQAGVLPHVDRLSAECDAVEGR